MKKALTLCDAGPTTSRKTSCATPPTSRKAVLRDVVGPASHKDVLCDVGGLASRKTSLRNANIHHAKLRRTKIVCATNLATSRKFPLHKHVFVLV